MGWAGYIACTLRTQTESAEGKCLALREVTGKRRKLHNEERNDLCCSPKVTSRMKSRIECLMSHSHEEIEKCVQNYVGKP